VLSSVGAARTDDPEEETRQRKFKSLLNKLTVDNFDRIFEQMCEIEMTRVATMSAFIDQIFEKALTEPIFGELYAQLCKNWHQRNIVYVVRLPARSRLVVCLVPLRANAAHTHRSGQAVDVVGVDRLGERIVTSVDMMLHIFV
jgi:MIF4G domain